MKINTSGKINRSTVAKHNTTRQKTEMLHECSNIGDISGAGLTGSTGYVSVSFCLKFRNKLDYLRVTEFSCKARRWGKK